MFELLRLFARSRQSARNRKYVEGRVALFASWNLTTATGEWFCPLCVRPAGKIADRARLADVILEHLASACTPWQAGLRDPALSTHDIETAARHHNIKSLLDSNPLFRQVDARGHWYCPFCVRATDIAWHGAADDATRMEVVRHVDNCFAWSHGAGRPHSLEALQAVIREKDAVVRKAAEIKPRVLFDPVWHVRDHRGYWACPYCRAVPAPVIDISTQLVLQKTASFQIAAHLLNDCAAHREGRPAAREMEDMEAAIGLRAMAVATSVAPPRMSEAAETKLLRKEIETAARMQKRMLHEVSQVEGFDIHVLFRPKDVVAGDFYDVQRLNDDEIGILIGDVSGHGIEAGMVMALVRKVITMHARNSKSPKEALAKANRDVYPDLERSVFATAIYGILNTRERKLTVARAGHTPFFLAGAKRVPPVSRFEPRGMGVGIDAGARFEASLEEEVIPLEPGDLVVFSTDGVNEQTNPKGEQFGMQRLASFIQTCDGHGSKEVVHLADLALTEFRGHGRMLDDDITMIALKVNPTLD